MRLLAVPCLLLLGCGSPDTLHAGTATITGGSDEYDLASNEGVSIVRVYAPFTELKVSPGGVACEATQGGDRITFDLAGTGVGTYTIVSGYPGKDKLAASHGRAHICPKRPEGGDQPPCDNVSKGGTLTITRFDGQWRERVEGTYKLTLANGEVSGTFSAYRCN